MEGKCLQESLTYRRSASRSFDASVAHLAPWTLSSKHSPEFYTSTLLLGICQDTEADDQSSPGLANPQAPWEDKGMAPCKQEHPRSSSVRLCHQGGLVWIRHLLLCHSAALSECNHNLTEELLCNPGRTSHFLKLCDKNIHVNDRLLQMHTQDFISKYSGSRQRKFSWVTSEYGD